MSSDKGKSKIGLQRVIRNSGSTSNSAGSSNEWQPGNAISTTTQPKSNIQLASIPSNQTSIHTNQTSIHGIIQQIKDAHDVMCKEKWSYTDRHGEEIYVAERIGRVLDRFEECAKIIDVTIQHHPDITALVWAGARFILMIVRNGIRFMDDLEAAIATTVEKMAACEYYAQIYHECLKVSLESAMTPKSFNDGLDSALKDLYAAVHAFLNKAMEYIDPGNSAAKKILRQLKPFLVTMQPLIEAIEDKEKKVKEYADMATMGWIKGVERRVFTVQDKADSECEDMFNVTKGLQHNLAEFQTQVVQALQPQQRGILSHIPLDAELQHLKDQYMAESQVTSVFEASLYVPTQGMNHPHAPENEHFDLAAHVRDFLAEDSPQKVCLIQGVAGSGKSTFNHYLATELWDTYCKADVDEKSSLPIPVFIPLANVFEPNRHNQDLIADFFRNWSDWPNETILRAKTQLRFVFLLDGYDEIENRDRNFYISNRLAGWNAKTVITSRPEYLGEGYQKGFIPPGQVQLLREYWIAPFSTTAMREYIHKYVKSRRLINTTSPKVEEYEHFLQRPELRSLISNPFLLKMVLTIDPRTITITDETDLKRGTLYQAFLKYWLDQGHERLLRVQLPPNLREAFTTLRERNFTRKAKRLCLDFAVELYRHKVLQVEYDDDAHSVWDNYLTDSDSQIRLLRYSLPLIRVGQVSYRFIHKSLRDFAIAQSIWQDDKLHTADALINEFHIVDDSGVIDFVVEQAERDPALQQSLLDCVNRSKGSAQFAQAASNAITILVRTGWRFNGADLRGIRIDRSDISDGWFDGAQLQNADLRRVRARGVWLRGADLTDARMDGIWFGEKPWLRFNFKEYERIEASTCFYSLDGELLVAFVIEKNEVYRSVRDVQVWSVSSRQLLHTFEGDEDSLLAFAPDGRLLASACHSSSTIRLYGLHQSHQKLRIFAGDFDSPSSLAFSVDGKLLALASEYNPVKLWSTKSGNILHTFPSDRTMFPDFLVQTVAFSPDGKLFAFRAHSSLVDVWSMEDYSLVHTFGDDGGWGNHVTSIAFSPDSQVLATWHSKFHLQLWSLPRKQLIDTFGDGHIEIRQMCYAPDGQMIATLSRDCILRLWSVAARKVSHEIDGVQSSIVFSPDGQLLAGLAADDSVRQWAVSQQLGNSPPNTGLVTSGIDRVAFWSNNNFLISASMSNTVRLWPLVTSATTNYVDVIIPRTIPAIELTALDANGKSVYVCNTAQLAPNSGFIIGNCFDGYVLWWFENKRLKYLYHPIENYAQRIVISPDGELLACSSKVWHDSSSRILKLIKRQTGETVHEFEYRYSEYLHDMVFSDDGQLIAIGDGNVVQFWSVPECRLLHTIKDISYSDFNIAFSPVDRMVAFNSEDNTIRLWSTSMLNFKYLNTFEGHTDRITSIVFSPDGDIIASGSHDRTLRFWSARSTKYLFCIDIRRPINTLAWRSDPGSEDLAVGTWDGVVHLWRVRKKADYTPENPSVEISCQWSSRLGLLYAPNLQIQDVTGLDVENLELLKQVGAVGDPVGAVGEPAGADGPIREIIDVEDRRGRKRGWTEQAE